MHTITFATDVKSRGIIKHLAKRKSFTTPEVARKFDISEASAAHLVRRLRQVEALTLVGEERHGSGRPHKRWQVRETVELTPTSPHAQKSASTVAAAKARADVSKAKADAEIAKLQTKLSRGDYDGDAKKAAQSRLKNLKAAARARAKRTK